MLNSVVPSIGREFGTSAQGLSFAISGYALAFAGLVLCGGALTDRLPRRQVLVWGLTTMGLGGALAMLAPTFWTVIAGRVLQGVAAAIILPAATALLASVYPSDPMRSRAFGMFASAQASCFAAGLVLGGVVTSALGWRWVFALHVTVAVATAATAVRWLPTGLPLPPQPLGPVRAGALVTANTNDAALSNWALLRLHSVRRAALVASVFFFCGTGSLFLLPLYLQQMHGLSPAASGFAILPVSLAVTTAALLSGRLMKTRGPRMLLMWGLPMTSAGVFLWCALGAHSPYVGAILAGLLITGIGQGLVYPALTAVGLHEVPTGAHGMASAVTIAALQSGGAIGPTVLAGIAQGIAPTSDRSLTLAGYHLGFAVAASAVLCLAIPAVVGLRTGSTACGASR